MTADPHPRPPLGVDDAGGIRRLTLDRPHARNAFDEALYGAVARSLAEAAVDDRIGVVLVTGAGRAFS
ncbi:MAG TPA: enoyl-CoA hydratase-related protein, partial [Acidimicrobiales bacterium]